MAGTYKNYLKLLESWPLDKSKTGRDLGQHLRDNIRIAFSKGEVPDNRIDREQCDRYYRSLQRLAANHYGNLYPRISTATASGLTPEECNLVLTPELQEYFLEEEGRVKKFLKKFKKDDPKLSEAQ